MKKQTRSEARNILFTLIFQLDGDSDTDEMIGELLSENPECEQNLGYITSVLGGVCEKNAELEDTISANLRNGWTVNRISKASLVILKLAIYEMKYVDDVPPKVAINEAVELAKTYGAENDAKFVNGLLASVYKSLNQAN